MGEEPPCDVPKITVVIPVYNRAGAVRPAVSSAVRQCCPVPFEVIVVDDGSTDGSAEEGADSGATVIRLERNGGVARARNRGILAARGEWVAFLDSDDVWAPSHLATLWAATDGVGLVASSGVRVSSEKLRATGVPSRRTIELRSPDDALRPENVVGTSACMIRTDLLRSVGGFDPGTWPEDLDLWLRVLRRAPGRVLPDRTVGWRTHTGQMSNWPENTVDRVVLMLEQHSAAGHLDVRSHRALSAVGRWDSFRSGRHTRLLELLKPSVGRYLPRLWWSRFWRRQLWPSELDQAELLSELIRSGGT